MKEMTGNGRRTRKDVFEEDWPEIAARLKDAPELEAKALFEDLLTRKPGVYQPGQVRTFQRRVLEWRAKEGPDQEVFFAQQHRPGEAMQTDFTCCNLLFRQTCLWFPSRSNSIRRGALIFLVTI
jgi:hypothetical protein